MGKGKSYMNMVIMVVGIVCLSIPIMPLTAQEMTPPIPSNLPNPYGIPDCLLNIGLCLGTKGVNSSDYTIDAKKCCPEIEKGIANATCFCQAEKIHQNITDNLPKVNSTYALPPIPSFSQVELEYNKMFADCKLGTTYDDLCDGVSADINGAIKIALTGLLPGALLIWALMMFL